MAEAYRGRYTLKEVRTELANPQEDYFTGSTQGPFVDTDRDDFGGQRINISQTTVEDFATLIGWIPGSEASEAFAKLKTVESENAVLRAQLDRLIDACRSVLDLQEYLQHDAETASRAAHPSGKSKSGKSGSSNESGSDAPDLL